MPWLALPTLAPLMCLAAQGAQASRNHRWRSGKHQLLLCHLLFLRHRWVCRHRQPPLLYDSLQPLQCHQRQLWP